jgi:hypothetical protein
MSKKVCPEADVSVFLSFSNLLPFGGRRGFTTINFRGFIKETAVEEAQDTSCLGIGVFPSFISPPRLRDIRD